MPQQTKVGALILRVTKSGLIERATHCCGNVVVVVVTVIVVVVFIIFAAVGAAVVIAVVVIVVVIFVVVVAIVVIKKIVDNFCNDADVKEQNTNFSKDLLLISSAC